jgi:hypothetical protein
VLHLEPREDPAHSALVAAHNGTAAALVVGLPKREKESKRARKNEEGAMEKGM